MHILVVDDDQAVRDSLKRSLEYNGYEVSAAEDGVQALARLPLPDRRGDHGHHDAAAGWPGERLGCCERLAMMCRSWCSPLGMPSVIGWMGWTRAATTIWSSPSRWMSCSHGSVLWYAGRAPWPTPTIRRPRGLSFSDLVLNTQTREVLRGNRSINLTRTEFALLEAFMRHPRRVLERSWLLNEVWGFDFPTTANSLEVYIGYLRRKTGGVG
jgi:two-component system response regulator MprA